MSWHPAVLVLLLVSAMSFASVYFQIHRCHEVSTLADEQSFMQVRLDDALLAGQFGSWSIPAKYISNTASNGSAGILGKAAGHNSILRKPSATPLKLSSSASTDSFYIKSTMENATATIEKGHNSTLRKYHATPLKLNSDASADSFYMNNTMENATETIEKGVNKAVDSWIGWIGKAGASVIFIVVWTALFTLIIGLAWHLLVRKMQFLFFLTVTCLGIQDEAHEFREQCRIELDKWCTRWLDDGWTEEEADAGVAENMTRAHRMSNVLKQDLIDLRARGPKKGKTFEETEADVDTHRAKTFQLWQDQVAKSCAGKVQQ